MKNILLFICMGVLGIISPAFAEEQAIPTLYTSSESSYQITQIDISVIETFEDALYGYIDEGKLDAEAVVERLEKIIGMGTMKPRSLAVLKVIVEDINYEYLWDAEDESYTLTAQDCYEDEYFDEEDEYCYAKEATGKDVDLLLGDTPDNFQGFHSDELPENTEAVYAIKGDLITLVSGVEDPTHKEIWGLYTKIIPSYFRENVKYFNFTNEPESDVDASVFRDENVHADWHVHVNRASYYDEETGQLNPEKIHTLIHEFSHIMTLGDGQIDEIDESIDEDIVIERFKNSCKTFFIHEGCLKEGSYLEEFMSQFWTQSDIVTAEELGGADAFGGEDVVTLYTGRETEYVTEYASTSAIEDIAESFGFFILKPKPTGTTIADKKILFFYSYPDLVKVRDIIRNRIK